MEKLQRISQFLKSDTMKEKGCEIFALKDKLLRQVDMEDNNVIEIL